jgi:DNA mismatch repair protein MutL
VAIELLDAETIGQIAAGEVIERPLSVVKELVENALDAGATRIAVRVRGGGITEIEVADDGSGIPAADVPRALLRHATSKLSQAAGLASIGTLGFRGEGLASIAAIARVTLVSRTPDAQIATAVEAFGEAIGEPQPQAGPIGTRVLVRDLFGNVPVRREYLRSPSAEFSRISQWLGTLSLAYPQVGFTLDHDGRAVFAFAPDDDLSLRLAHVFGPSARTMVGVDRGGDARVSVRGWISSPGDDRPDRRAQVLFVNGRLLRSTLVSGAWSAAYRTFAMVGRHPYGVLYLSVPPEELDPNVHPTKSDVRLRYGDRVLAVVREAMSAALRRGAIERLEKSISFAPPGGMPILPFDAAPGRPAQDDTGAVHDDGRASGPLRLLEDDAVAGGGLRVLAQVARTYILATDGAAVVLIDQHAAHERIVFEQLAANADADVPAEPLLVPHTFEVGPDEAERLEATLDALARGGLEIEAFGERAYRITTTPARLIHAGKTRTFDVADFIDCLGDDARGLDANQRVWASLACHSVVRAGETLAFAEMTTLVERLGRCENPMHCPHGRPTIVRLDPEQIARLFKRV